ncbi:MAG: hypothetical protein QOE99_1242 [Actinomycetota bacterium]|nr:hypothetical protein [Actinomycetota bacterium]
MTDAQTPTPSYDAVLAALTSSHERLVRLLRGLDDDAVDRPSYASEWTIAQVASHLGSGAEIFGLMVEAGQAGQPAPGGDTFAPIWDAWNAKSGPEQVRDALRADAEFLDLFSKLTGEQIKTWRLDMFGTVRSLTELLQMRLAEHALHTWDIEVALDPTATLPDDAAGLVLDNLGFLVSHAAKASAEPRGVQVSTSSPDRSLLLQLSTEGATLSAATGAEDAAASLRAPSEAFVRLVYGRLDPEHTPGSVQADPDLLDQLRKVFPGV